MWLILSGDFMGISIFAFRVLDSFSYLLRGLLSNNAFLYFVLGMIHFFTLIMKGIVTENINVGWELLLFRD